MTRRDPPPALLDRARLDVLHSYGILDTPPEQEFDDIVRLAATVFDTPIAVISLVERNRVWFKARIGLAATEYPWDMLICPEAISSDGPLIVPDITADPRFSDLPSVTGAPNLRFYAGVPLVVASGHRLGMLNVADRRPRTVTKAQIEALRALGRQVVSHLERRIENEHTLEVGERWVEAEAERAAQQQIIRGLEERFRLAFDEAPIGMALVDLRPGAVGQLLQVNRALSEFLGYPEVQLEGRAFQSLPHPDDLEATMDLTMEVVAGTRDNFHLEKRYLHRDATVRWGALHASALRDLSGSLVCMLIQVVDMTTRHEYEEELIRAATTDGLTGLANRYALLRQLSGYIEDTDSASAAVLLIDLDGFKLVNNAVGHLAGDEVLRVVATRFVDVAGPGNRVARIAGDEFAVLCRNMGEEEAADLAEALIASLAEPIDVSGHHLYLTASIGVAWTDASDARAGTVLENADSARYEAKRRGRARWELYDDHLRAAATVRLHRASGLRAALQDDQLELQYQPIVDLRTGLVVSTEALLRWNHPDEGVIWPDDFIAVAEESGTIVAIGRWALRTACREAVKWGPDGPGVSVNVSARQLADDTLTQTVEEALLDSGLPPHRLTLEVTETAVMADTTHAVRVLRRLKTVGVNIAVDDFGTGYSSLQYLKRLPVDKLKIDRSFVDSLPEDNEDIAIVATVVALARAIGLQVIAEGVETPAQAETLRTMGCDLGQGFLWGRPLPAAEAIKRFSGPQAVEGAGAS